MIHDIKYIINISFLQFLSIPSFKDVNVFVLSLNCITCE